MKKKTTQPNTPKKRPRKIESFGDYLEMTSLRMKPISDSLLERIALELVKWAMNDEKALKVTSFFRPRGINSNDIKRWRARNAKFDAAYDFSLGAIGDRREHGAITKKYDTSMILKSMPHYDPDWKALETWRSSLRKEEQEQKTTSFNINVPSFKETKDDDSRKDT